MNRAINRHRWDYPALRERLAQPDTDQTQVMAGLRARLRLRRRQPAFHPNATQFTIHTADDRVFGLWRQSLDRKQSIFALHNVSAAPVILPSTCLNLIDDEDWRDILSGDGITDDDITLAPYQCRWISNAVY